MYIDKSGVKAEKQTELWNRLCKQMSKTPAILSLDLMVKLESTTATEVIINSN